MVNIFIYSFMFLSFLK